MNELAKNAKSFISIYLKSVVTLGIYWWVYLFRTIYKIKGVFVFDDKEIKPNEVKTFLIAYLVVYIVSGLINISYALPLTLERHVAVMFVHFYFIINILYLGFTVAFWDVFVGMLRTCQKRTGLGGNKLPFWILIFLMVVSHPSHSEEIGVETSALVLLNGIIFTFLMYYLVRQINKIWTNDVRATSDIVKAAESDINIYRKKQPLTVTVISWIFIIWGAESSLLILYLYGLFDFPSIVLFTADIVLILCGIGMLKGANWARLLYLWADLALCLFILFGFASTETRFFDTLGRIILAHVTITSVAVGFWEQPLQFLNYPWCSILYIVSAIILLRSNVLAFFRETAGEGGESQQFREEENCG